MLQNCDGDNEDNNIDNKGESSTRKTSETNFNLIDHTEKDCGVDNASDLTTALSGNVSVLTGKYK